MEHERWEYATTFLFANIESQGAREALATKFPSVHPSKWEKYAPQAVIPDLDAWGEKGWELIHMEPVYGVGQNADVGFSTGGGSPAVTHWSHAYFCVFKKRLLPQTSS